MMTTDKLQPGEIANLADHTALQKREAHAAAMRAIAGLLDELRTCLSGARLQGLPRLSRFSISAYHGVRLRRKDPASPLDLPDGASGWGPEALVLNADGELVVARQNEHGEVNEREAGVGDLKAEDLQTVTAGIFSALQYARNYAQERGEVLGRITDFANDLGGMLRDRRGRR
jgi:hypothetical protein